MFIMVFSIFEKLCIKHVENNLLKRYEQIFLLNLLVSTAVHVLILVDYKIFTFQK